MKKVAYFNDSPRFVHIGGVMIPPNETREVEAVFVETGEAAEPLPKPEPGDDSGGDGSSAGSGSGDGTSDAAAIAELQKKTATVIKEALPTLTDEQLVALNAAEEGANAPRKGVLEAIAAEQLKRAQG